MKSSFRALYALLALLAVAQAAPPRAGKHFPSTWWTKRQPGQLVLTETETRTEVFSETLTETFTETITTSNSDFPGSETSSGATLTSTSAFHLPTPERHVEGDVPNQDPSAQSVFFLPADSSGTASATGQESSVSPTSDGTDNVNSGDTGPAFAVHRPAVKGPLVSAYYPDWAASTLPPEKIDMSRLDWIDFAFGVLSQDCSIGFDDSSSQDILNRVVSAAHSKSTKVKLSIGGWSGSRYFSACSGSGSRNTFVSNMVNIYNQFRLDGLDIDWEYPGQQGEGSNGVSPQDSDNFLKTLQLLRSKLPSSAIITAAVQDVPFAGSNGNPMSDVSSFANVLDWVNIMNYDVFGSSSIPGPNAPLDNGCKDSSQPQFNAHSAISAWTNARFPASQLMLGVPFYGYLSSSSATQLQHKKRSLVRRQVGGVTQDPFNVTSAVPVQPPASTLPVSTVPVPSSVPGNVTDAASNITSVDSKAGEGTPGTVTLHQVDGGQIQFLSIVQQGALMAVRAVNGTQVADTTTFVGAGGFTRFFDSCSSTPFLSSPYANQVVTYDDTDSLGRKASFAKQSGILGAAVWDLSGDTPQWDLTNALRRGLGKPV